MCLSCRVGGVAPAVLCDFCCREVSLSQSTMAQVDFLAFLNAVQAPFFELFKIYHEKATVFAPSSLGSDAVPQAGGLTAGRIYARADKVVHLIFLVLRSPNLMACVHCADALRPAGAPKGRYCRGLWHVFGGWLRIVEGRGGCAGAGGCDPSRGGVAAEGCWRHRAVVLHVGVCSPCVSRSSHATAVNVRPVLSSATDTGSRP